MHTRVLVSLYLLSLFLIGVGYIAMMPPFEGFDEPAHFSSLRQIADTGTIPLFGKSYFPKDVADYGGPVAYATLQPPFDRRLTYAKFFAQPDLVTRFVQNYRQPTPHPPFIPSTTGNWEAQQAPLYYVMLAPLMRSVETAPFVTQILVLRLVSFSLAMIGVFFALWAISIEGTFIRTKTALTGFLIYPIMLPMFFPEFARTGNDSLCLLLAGMAAFFLTKRCANEERIGWTLALGVTLGIGLLTKVFFLPITFVIGAFLLLRSWQSADGKTRRLRLRHAATTLVLAVLIGSGWYLYETIAHGILIGDIDAAVHHSGFFARLQQYLTIYDLVRSVVVIFVTWIWAGTWSLARMSNLLYAPVLVLSAVTIGALALRLRRAPLTDPVWLTVALFAVFCCCLMYPVVLIAANGGQEGSSGWYLHILMPWVAPALGLGVEVLLQRMWTRLVFIGLLLYAALFQVMAVWAQFALFTGCALKADDKYYSFPGHLFCLDQAPTLFDRLSIIGWPSLAAIGFGGGIICATILAVWIGRREPLYVPPAPLGKPA